MSRARIRAIVAMSAASVLLAACGGGGGGGGGSEDPIVVGAVYSVTGSQASIDEPGLKGFQLAAKQINAAGGVLGRQIEVVHVDAQSDQTTLTNVVSELIDNEGAVALGGINDSTFALAAGPDRADRAGAFRDLRCHAADPARADRRLRLHGPVR